MRSGAVKMPRGRKPPWVLIAACLLLGMLTSVLIAWAIAARWDVEDGQWSDGPASEWPATPPAGWPTPQFLARGHSVGWDMLGGACYSWSDTTVSPGSVPSCYRVYVRRYGFPMRAMKDLTYTQAAGATFTETDPGLLRRGFSPSWLPSGPPISPRIPLMPSWPGFAVNAVFYAVAWRALATVPFAFRRILRRSKGLCPRCAYDLRDRPHSSTLPCPECGDVQNKPLQQQPHAG